MNLQPGVEHGPPLPLTCGREAGDGKEAEDGRVQQAVRADDAENGVLVDDLEDGPDLRCVTESPC